MIASARGALRLAVSTTLLAALVAVGALGFTGTPSSTAVAAAPIGGSGRPAVLPAPAFPELNIPDVPLPRATETGSDTSTVRFTCEPWADARMDDPAHPNRITNKDCAEINAAKERAQREFRDQMDREAAGRTDEEVGDWRESACSDPSSSVYGTATCGGDVNGDGLIDGTNRSTLTG